MKIGVLKDTGRALPEEDAAALARTIGLAVCHVGIYGAAHPVTAKHVEAAYEMIAGLAGRHSEIEIFLDDRKLLINRTVVEVAQSSGKLLVDQMARIEARHFEIASSIDRDEFGRFIDLLGSTAAVINQSGGFEDAVRKAGLRHVVVRRVSYKRVTEGTKPAPAVPAPPLGVAPAAGRRPAVSSRTFDLSDDTELPAADWELFKSPPTPVAPAAPAPSTQRPGSLALASRLREAAAMLESGQAQDVAIQSIRDEIESVAAESEGHIDALVEQVAADRDRVASIEADARRRGLTLRLSREELITRVAELNQEIMQPLTVSTGVLEMMRDGRLGAITPGQQHMVAVALESMARAEQLVRYLERISGLPTELKPDHDILDDAYGRR